MSSIINYAKKVVTPSQKLQQKKQRVAKKAYDLVSQCIEKYPQVVGFEFGGSYAKGTWVSEKPVDNVDIDILLNSTKQHLKGILEILGRR